MSGPNSIPHSKLVRLVGTPGCPVLLDVRTAEDFAADPRLLPGSKRLAHTDVEALQTVAGEAYVVVCQRGAKLSHGAAALLRLRGHEAASLDGGFEAWREARLPLIPVAVLPQLPTAKPTRWVTRHRPKIDRIACPWLIRRFVDPQAEFLFVPPEDVEGVAQRFDATPFDMPEGFWTHRGETCSFDTMLEEFALKTDPLLHMARIIRAADTGKIASEPEAAGLLAISLGLSRQYSDDLQQLDAGLTIYDALYRWCRDATDETHNWPSPGKSLS
jgi:rhodanese-related sulfurtransferase